MGARAHARRGPGVGATTLAAAAMLWGFGSATRADATLPAGAIVVLGALPGDAALAGAEAEGGARWRLERLEGARPVGDAGPEEALAALGALYANGDFLHCLGASQDARLSPDELLATGDRAAAAAALGLTAACAHGAGDEAVARAHLDRLFVAELDGTALEETTPELQALAETVEAEVRARAKVRWELRTRPEGATLAIDGAPLACDEPRCVVEVRPGRHVVSASRLGFERRSGVFAVEAAGARTLALDPASADRLREQLSAAAEAAEPDREAILAVAPDAFGARVIVLAWRSGERTALALYDRQVGRVVARATATTGREDVRAATASVVSEWRGETEPTPLLAEPWFWTAALGIAAAVGTTVYLVTRPEERRHDLVFP